MSVKDGTLIGVASFGVGCGREEYPGVYARVASVRTWLDENIQTEREHIFSV